MNRGKIEALYSILDFIKRGSEDYVAIKSTSKSLRNRYTLRDISVSTDEGVWTTLICVILPLRDWDLNRKNGGIAVFPPYVSNSARSMNRGKIVKRHLREHRRRRLDYSYLRNPAALILSDGGFTRTYG